MKNFLNIFLSFMIIGSVFSSAKETNPKTLNELQGAIENLINDTINAIVKDIPDPVIIENLNLTLTEDVIRGEIRANNLEITGLDKLVATHIKAQLLSLEANTTILIPELIITSNYDIDILIAEIVPVYGSGPITIKLEKIQVDFDGKLHLGQAFTVSNVTAAISLESSDFNIEGLLNNEELSALINAVLNDNFTEFVDTYQDVISRIISPILENLINSLIPLELPKENQNLYQKLNNFNAID